MKKLFLSLALAATFSATAVASSSSSTPTISSLAKMEVKKVKYEGQLHRIKFSNGTEAVFLEGKNGSMQLICICSA